MSDETKTSEEGGWLGGVARVLETDIAKQAYEDLLQPPFKATGNALATLIQVVVQRPTEALAEFPQKIAGMVKQILNRVPEERLLAAPAEVAGPVIEGIRYLPEGHPLFEMYGELLTRSCDRETRSEANPAFAEVIKTLSPDEARILYWVWLQEERNVRVLRKIARRYKSTEHRRMGFAQYGTEIQCLELPYWNLGNQTPHHVNAYMSHLEHLGLISYFDIGRHDSGNHRVDVEQVHVSAYGYLFCAVCIPLAGFTAHNNDFHSSHWEYVNAPSVE